MPLTGVLDYTYTATVRKVSRSPALSISVDLKPGGMAHTRARGISPRHVFFFEGPNGVGESFSVRFDLSGLRCVCVCVTHPLADLEGLRRGG